MTSPAQPYQPSLGDWVTTQLRGVQVTARVVGFTPDRPSRLAILCLAHRPDLAVARIEPWMLDEWAGSGYTWLEGWHAGPASSVQPGRDCRPATTSEIRQAQLSQLQAGGL